MADLSIEFCGVKSPNPFWLASGPPTNSGDQIHRAFDAGWGGAVWKTIGTPVRNVNSRYAGLDHGRQRLVGMNNIELISDRGVSDNLREMAEVKKNWPNHAVVASIMADKQEEWAELVRRCEDHGADALELNFGCPHGMCERGMGSAIGQEPKVAETITAWVKAVAKVPVLVKLTPNVADITEQGMAVQLGGGDAVALINTIKSIIGVDLDDFVPFPKVRGRSTNGGYCGRAVKPIALHMVASLARHESFSLPVSGMGGVSTWEDAAEFIALGSTSIQVCTEVMHKGFAMVRELSDGLSSYLDSKGMASVNELRGKAAERLSDWGDLDMNYKIVADIDAERCIACHKCYVSCNDGAYQAIALPPETPGETQVPSEKQVPKILDDKCTGCNLCSLVCPVGCISMRDVSPTSEEESWNQITARGGYTVTDGIL